MPDDKTPDEAKPVEGLRNQTRAERRAAQHAERLSLTQGCEAEIKQCLDHYGATLNVVRIVRVQPDGSEQTTYQLEVVIPE